MDFTQRAVEDHAATDCQLTNILPLGYNAAMKNAAAVALGRIKTKRKAASSRANGKLGGRPKKNAIRGGKESK